MKKYLITIVALLVILNSNAQINVGSSVSSQGNNAGNLSDEDIAGLKKSTTLFVLQKKDYAHKTDFENAISIL